MHRKIERWLEKLPEGVESIILRAGEDRRQETILERWNPDDVPNILDEALELMEEEVQGRLIAYGEKGKQLRSITIRNDIQTNTQTETGLLVEGILRMAEEQRRFVATITDSFQVMHETIQDALYKERDHQEEITELQLALALEQADNESNEPSTTDKALGVISQVLQAKASPGDPVQVAKDMVLNNPEIIDSLLDDESIVDLVTKKIMK